MPRITVIDGQLVSAEVLQSIIDQTVDTFANTSERDAAYPADNRPNTGKVCTVGSNMYVWNGSRWITK